MIRPDRRGLAALLLAATLALGLGCGADVDNPAADGAPRAAEATAPTGSEETAEPEPEADESVDASPPEIQFETQSHNFGEHFAREKPEFEFTFENTGGSDLVIQRVLPNCTACTVASYTKEPVPPGGTGFVRVVLTSDGMGPARKYVDVYSNATNARNGKTRLFVSANWKERVWWDKKGGIELGKIKQGARFDPVSTEITWLQSHPIEVVRIQTGYEDHPGLVEVKSTPIHRGDREGLKLDISFGPPDHLLRLSGGNHVFGSIIVHTTDELYKEIVIRFSGEVAQQVVVIPRKVVYPKTEEGILEPRKVKLAAPPNAGLVLERYECTLPFLEVSVEETKKGALFVITLTAIPEVPPGPHKGELILYTDFDKQPVFTVPVEISG